jgi:hypothetical protein
VVEQTVEEAVKSIPLKTLEATDGSPPVEYAVVLREVVRRPSDPQKGVDIPEMRQSIRVLDALDSANGTLELEDADYTHLKDKLLAFKWNMVDKRIVQLIDDVSNA